MLCPKVLNASSILQHQQIIQIFDTQSLITAAMTQGSGNMVALQLDPGITQATMDEPTRTNPNQGRAIGNRSSSRIRRKWQYVTPTRWLGWSLQIKAWSYLDGLTFNFRVWNNTYDDSPLFEFAKIGDSDGLRDLLRSKEASVTDLNSQNKSALHVRPSLAKESH